MGCGLFFLRCRVRAFPSAVFWRASKSAFVEIVELSELEWHMLKPGGMKPRMGGGEFLQGLYISELRRSRPWKSRWRRSPRVPPSNDGNERRIAPQALSKFKTRVREITRNLARRLKPIYSDNATVCATVVGNRDEP